MTTKKSKKSKDKKSDATIKGRLVEMIVASLHEESGVKVQQNIRLPSLINPKRKREIDILLSGSISGYPIRIAIECKNYKSIIDAPKIDSFVGKLQQIGIPSQHGVFISAHGFTAGAIDRAKEAGIKTLRLTGLTIDRLASELFSAIQSVIYLLPEITTIRVTNGMKEIPHISFLWFLYDKEKKMKGSIPDLVWKMWTEGKIEPLLQETEIDVPIPSDWQNLIGEELVPITSAQVKVKIKGLVGHIQGSATNHGLIDSSTNELDKFRVNIKFDTEKTTFPISSFFSEEEMQKHLSEQKVPIKITLGRIMVPRIFFNYLYWPLSERSFKEYKKLVENYYSQNQEPTSEELRGIEGTDIATAWEPPWDENPFLTDMTKKQN